MTQLAYRHQLSELSQHPNTGGQTMVTWRAPHRWDRSMSPQSIDAAISAALERLHLPCELRYGYRFQPQGYSFVALGASLRVVIHTWPERGICTGDFAVVEGEKASDRLMCAISWELGWVVAEHRSHTRSEAVLP